MENEETNPVAEVTIEKWVYGGAGLGRWNGQVVLAPFTLPGERVQFEAGRRRPDLIHARVTRRETDSAVRVEPGCRYFVRCGGCHYQQAPYEYQVERKKEILAETLRRMGKVEPPEEIASVTGEPWGYRNRSQFHLKGGQIGYLEAESRRLVDVEACPISSPRLNEALKTLRRMMKDRRWPGFIRSIELFTNEAETMVNVVDTEGGQRVARSFFDWCAAGMRGASAGELLYAVGADKYRVSHGSFFQTNRFLIEGLVDQALEGAGGGTALDLYAGVGLFAVPMARRFTTVKAIESNAQAARDLHFNAAAAGGSIEAVRGNTEAFLENLTETPDYVLADPPRAGLGPAVARHLVRLKPARLTVVSCDPATLARDVKGLVAGGYRMDRLTLVDLFPQTYHIESIVQLTAS